MNGRVFDALYARSLIYNTCWEDPAVDRQALQIAPGDRVMVIASAGCNALDYALAGARHVDAVDMNPRQIALLELKLAGIRALDFEDFFALFGSGRHPAFPTLYRASLREQLSPFARAYWDRHGRVFSVDDQQMGGLYYHGLSGKVARGFALYRRMRPALGHAINDLLAASDLDSQREIYDRRVAPRMWNDATMWVLSRQSLMHMLGVPQSQRLEVETQHAGGVAGFVREAIDYVFRQLPLSANYFWQVYLNGRYTRDCCPEYLVAENFARLKDGLVDRVHHHTTSVTAFLRTAERSISKFVLLDHMDWMSSYDLAALSEEWDNILGRARAGARVIFRSACEWPAYLEKVRTNQGSTRLLDCLEFHPTLSAALTTRDRVHTYGGFHVADVLH